MGLTSVETGECVPPLSSGYNINQKYQLQCVTNKKQSTRQMISIICARETTPTRIVLLTPPPVNTFQCEADLPAREACDRDFSATKQYAEAVVEVAKTEGVPQVVDVWSAMYEAAERDERKLEKFLHDGLRLGIMCV